MLRKSRSGAPTAKRRSPESMFMFFKQFASVHNAALGDKKPEPAKKRKSKRG